MKYVAIVDKNAPSIEGSPREDSNMNMIHRGSQEYKVDKTTPFLQIIDDQSDD